MIVFKYVSFAAFATGVNLLTQFICLSLYQGNFSIFVAIGCGTLTGLIAKYILDKKFIFYVVPMTKRKDLNSFLQYSLTGLVTTSIFWFTELLFAYAFEWQGALYVGAVVGLAIGYSLKYFLDKKFVFRPEGKS